MNTRLLTICCLIYTAMLFYGTLVPFDLTTDADIPASQLLRERDHWYDGFVNNKRDMVGNFVVFIPLGVLVAVRHSAHKPDLRRLRLVLLAAAACGAVSCAIEAIQLWSLTRTTEVVDLVTNTTGGTLGGLIGATVGRRYWQRLALGWPARWRVRPARAVAAALLLFLLLDALDPLYPVLRYQSFRGNLQHCHWTIAAGLAGHAWHHWLVCRVGVYAVLAVVIGAGAMDRSRWRWARGAVVAAAFAVITEAVKPFIHDRWANVANPVMAACGAAVGLALGLALNGRLHVRAKAILAVALLAGYLGYWEFRPKPEHAPIRLVWNGPAVKAKLADTTKLWPGEYFATEKKRVRYVRPVVRILAVTAAATYALLLATGVFRHTSLRCAMVRAAALTAAVGVAIQLFKLLIPQRGPTTGRLLCFAIGGALGVWLHRTVRPPQDAASADSPGARKPIARIACLFGDT